MAARPCPICGAENGTCGDQPLVFAPLDLSEKGAQVADDKIYLPKQTTNRGVAGYRGENIVVVDPATGKEDKKATTTANKSAADQAAEQAEAAEAAAAARPEPDVVTTKGVAKGDDK